jgi:hypothetical protein
MWIVEVLDYAREMSLDLTAHFEEVPLPRIDVLETVDPKAVESIARRLRKGKWPEDLPYVVLASNRGEGYMKEGYIVLDGHHRLAAAESLKWRSIPALVVSYRVYDIVASRYGLPRVDYINEILANADPLVAKNAKKDAGGGRPKKRIVRK